ncbi:MAG: penicillin-binding transpeptidase domain-containing protein [Clostridium sp.]|nr:penicillin-binding transpeptidase domain-containing protein [Bacteroides sp.]MCM1197793.1 penicillin-binding transpeptidase domain-containing protein [Clostridium sp.]
MKKRTALSAAGMIIALTMISVAVILLRHSRQERIHLAEQCGTILDRYGNEIELHGISEGLHKIGEGHTIHTSIDMEMQTIADSALRNTIGDDRNITGACLVIMEVKTGAIRAMVNLGRHCNTEGELQDTCNIAIRKGYSPGSVMQTAALAAALSDGYISSLDDFLTTDEFITSSSSIGLCVFKWYNSCPEKFTDALAMYCYSPMRFDLEGLYEADIITPDDLRWSEMSLTLAGNGFGYTISPLDILTFYNTIANRGRMMQPYIIESISGIGCYGEHVVCKNALSRRNAGILTEVLKECTERGSLQKLQNAKCKMQNAKCKMQNANLLERKAPHAKCSQKSFNRIGHNTMTH